jgi:hypothetical protein
LLLGYLLILLGEQTIPERIRLLNLLRAAIQNWRRQDAAEEAPGSNLEAPVQPVTDGIEAFPETEPRGDD